MRLDALDALLHGVDFFGHRVCFFFEGAEPYVAHTISHRGCSCILLYFPGCLVDGDLPRRVKWHPKKMSEPASFKIIKKHLLPMLREATRIAPTSSEKAKIVIGNLRYAMRLRQKEPGLSVEQLQLLETEFMSTSEQVAILLRFVEKWTPVMSAQVDDFIDDDVIDNLKEKLNRLKQYTNDPSTDGEILY